MLRKSLALFLCISLLGQNALFAAAAQPSQQPQNLAQYQQRAKEDLRRTPWIAREGKYILGIGGTSLALLITQQVRHQHKIQALQKQYAKALRDIRHNADITLAQAQSEWNFERNNMRTHFNDRISSLEQELATVRAEKQALAEELRLSNIKMEGWKKSSEVQRSKRLAAMEAASQREAQLMEELEKLQIRFNQKKSHYMDIVHYSTNLDAELTKYEKLFDKSVPEAERKALRQQLTQEPWLLNATKAQQEEFLDIIDQASAYRRGTYKEAGDGFMRFLIRKSMDKNMPLYERLIGMCRHIFHSKNLLTVALIVTLGMSAHDVHAQKMADRINTNFELFLNATPEELAVMEQNEEVRNICIQGAEALHVMSQMSPSEAAVLRESLQEQAPTPVQTGARGTINLAR